MRTSSSQLAAPCIGESNRKLLIENSVEKKKSETELTASVLKKKNQNTQEIRRTLFNKMEQDLSCSVLLKSVLLISCEF